MARISVDQRVVLVFHHYLGLTVPEIAERLELPVGTVKSRLHYAHLRDAGGLRGRRTPDHRHPGASRMTAPRDPDRLVRAYLADGPAELSPRLAQAIRDDVQRTNQRASRRSWRMPPMPRLLLVLAPLAALVLVIGALALGGGSNGPPPAATAQPSPVASAVAVGSVSPAPESPPVVAAGEEWIVYEAPDGFVHARQARRLWPDTGRWTTPTRTRPRRIGRPTARSSCSRATTAPPRTSGSWVPTERGGRALTPDTTDCSPCLHQEWARWSPDGTEVAFVSNEVDAGRTLRNDLVIVDVATGTTRSIATSDAQQFAVPSWSPDGSRIVVAVATYATLATHDTDGTLPESVELAIIDPAAAEPVLEPIAGLPVLPGTPRLEPRRHEDRVPARIRT